MWVEDVSVEMVVQMVECNGVMWVLPKKKERKNLLNRESYDYLKMPN
jgi:hypothetical protein